MLGRRLSILWSEPPCWFDGTVRDISADLRHYVVYDDGDVRRAALVTVAHSHEIHRILQTFLMSRFAALRWHDLDAEHKSGRLRWFNTGTEDAASAGIDAAGCVAHAYSVDAVAASDSEDAESAVVDLVDDGRAGA